MKLPSAKLLPNPLLSAVMSGQDIFEIHCVDNLLYVNIRTIEYVTIKNRIICGFNPFQGLKLLAINQFNRQYRCWDIRGNHLNMFRCYSLSYNLAENINKFMRKFKKQTGYDLPKAIFNSR